MTDEVPNGFIREKTWLCPKCNRVFATQTSYEHHYLCKHIDDEEEVSALIGNVYKPKPGKMFVPFCIIVTGYNKKYNACQFIPIDAFMCFPSVCNESILDLKCDYDIDHPLSIEEARKALNDKIEERKAVEESMRKRSMKKFEELVQEYKVKQ